MSAQQGIGKFVIPLLKRLGILAADGTYSGGLSGLGSTDNAVVRTDGTGGDRVQGSLVTVDDDGNVVLPPSAAVLGLRFGTTTATTTIRSGGGNPVQMEVSGGVIASFGPGVLNFAGPTLLRWFPGVITGPPDTGLRRAAAGVVQVTDGGSGGGALRVGTYTVATLPSASTVGAGTIVYVSDGAAGSPVLAFSDGTAWLRCDTLAAVSSS